MDRLQLIQTLIKKRKFKTYLEIGVLGGYVFFDVKCQNKIAVDPRFKFNWKGRVGQMFRNLTNIRARFFETSSDEFFTKHAPRIFKNKLLDIVLIDGMHEFQYALNDVINSLQYLSQNGVIVLHDCNPQSEEAECSFDEWKKRGYSGYWNGDVWKVIPYLRETRPDLNIFVADCDQGLGIITRIKGVKANPKSDSFDEVKSRNFKDLEKDRIKLLNLQAVSFLEQFISK